MILLALTVALAAPIAAFADTTAPTPASTASQTCKQDQTNMGPTLFAQTYAGSGPAASAFGKCVSSHAKSAQDQNANAAQSCKAQQADTNFAAAHGGKTFDQVYGSNNSKGKGADNNAFGKDKRNRQSFHSPDGGECRQEQPLPHGVPHCFFRGLSISTRLRTSRSSVFNTCAALR